MAKGAGVKKSVPTHFLIHTDKTATHQTALVDLRKHFSAAISIAEDLDVYDI